MRGFQVDGDAITYEVDLEERNKSTRNLPFLWAFCRHDATQKVAKCNFTAKKWLFLDSRSSVNTVPQI